MRFYTFLYTLFSVRRAKWYQGKDNESEYDYLIICRYLNRLLKKSEDKFVVNRKLSVCYIKIIMWDIFTSQKKKKR